MESPSSFPHSIDNRLPRSQTSRCGMDRSDHQSLILLAIGYDAIVLYRLIAIAGQITNRWEWHGKICTSDSFANRFIGPPASGRSMPGEAHQVRWTHPIDIIGPFFQIEGGGGDYLVPGIIRSTRSLHNGALKTLFVSRRLGWIARRPVRQDSAVGRRFVRSRLVWIGSRLRLTRPVSPGERGWRHE
jgi:hypothetical protein